MRKHLPTALVLMLALGFSADRAQPPKPNGAPPPRASESISRDAEEVLDRFISMDHSESHLRYLIATVPDPEVGYCAFRFDTIVESIQVAAEAEGYQLRAFWLPWERARDGKDADGKPREKSPQQGSRKKRPRSDFGLLLFDANSEKTMDPLAVLLVSETPVLGLNYEAFDRALNFVRRKKPPGRVHVLGPTYSGTAIQLKAAIQKKQAQMGWSDIRFDLASGTATSVDECLFQDLHNVSYHAFSESLQNVQQRFLRYLERLGVSAEQVALLSESGTVFGAGSRKGDGRSLQLQFPLAMSRLRNAYESDPALNIRLGPNDAGRKKLELPLTDSEARNTDRIPVFSPDLTAVSQEMVMQNITETLRRERIQAIGISATDVLDGLFLAQMLQTECPNARVFTLDSDVLFQHVSLKASYYGLLLVSPYPLFTANQEWQRPAANRQLLHFTSRGSQGVFNAARWSLAGSCARLIEYGSPFRASSEHPPVWVTVVGRDGIWPVRALHGAPAQDGKPAPSAMQPVPQGSPSELEAWQSRPSLLWYAGVWMLLILGGWRVVHTAAARFGRNLPGLFEVPAMPGRQARIYHVIVDLSLAAAVAPAMWVQCHYAWLAWDGREASWPPFAVSVLLVLVAGGLLASPVVWMIGLGRVSCVLMAGLGVAAAVAVCVLVSADSQLARIFILRSLYPENGVSPLVSPALLAIGVAAWSGMQLQRLRLCQVRWPGYPDMSGADFRLHGLNDCARRVSESVRKLWRESWAVILGGITFAALFRFLNVQTLESRLYDYVVRTGIAMLAALTLFTTARFLALWFALRPVLARLDSHSIRDAFERMGKRIPDLSPFAIWRVCHMGQQGSRAHAMVTLVPSVHRLVEIQAWIKPKELRLARLAVAKALAIGSQDPRRERALCIAGRSLNRIASGLVNRLRTYYWGDFDGEPAGANPQASSQWQAAEEMVALRWAAFIRSTHAQLRNKLEFMSAGSILLLLSTVAYPMYPRHNLMLLVSALFIFSGLSVLFVFYQMERNAILSRMSRTTPGKLGKQFYGALLSYGTLPLLTLLAYHFPEVTRSLNTMMGPITQGLR